ncbi:alpha-galactosidase [Tessaracoccus lubricantis]|uniref:alpha-galactosidase n=2 Tax=Tessaracoccus lubricantis TaxID=545543 RepID=A0ABP9EYS5_9ACTN
MAMTIHLRADGVSLLLTTDGGLPEVKHWGADLGPVTADDAAALFRAAGYTAEHNAILAPLRVGIVPEARHGWMGTPGLVGSRGGRGWTPAWRLTGTTFDGRALADGFAEEGPGALEFSATADDAGLALALRVELLPTGLVRAQATVTNTADDEYSVDQLALAMPVPKRATEVLDFGGRWASERVPQRFDLTIGTHRREGRRGRTGHDAAYVLHVGERGFGYDSGEIWAVHTAWSGNHLHYAEQVMPGVQVIGGGELLLPGEGRLAAGASYTSPWVYFNHAVGLDPQAWRFHRHLRSLPVHPDTPRPVTLNSWEAVYFDHDAEHLRRLVDRAAEVGVERFVLDDGWFGARRSDAAGLGDWVVSADAHPEGLHPLVSHVRGRGMQFGLWFEPEMVNPDSDLAREHPEWILQPEGRLPGEWRNQQVLNLAIDGAYRHVRDQVSAILAEYAVDYVKWDHNRDLVDAGSALDDGRPGVSAQTRAFYRLLDELRERHPDTEFESCSSGGARIDLEVLERVERVWVSDNIDPHSRQRMLWWTGQLLPLELMGSHIASGTSHTTGRSHTIEYRAATALFGHLGIEWDLTKATEEELAALRLAVGLYKEVRGLLHTGRVVRVDMGSPHLYLKGVVSPERALFSFAVIDEPMMPELGEIRLPGLEPESRYRVSLVGLGHELGVMTGRQLATVGIRLAGRFPEVALLIDVARV